VENNYQAIYLQMVATCDIHVLDVHHLLRWCGFLVKIINTTDESELLTHCVGQLAEASQLLPPMLGEADGNLRLRIGAAELSRAAHETLLRFSSDKPVAFTLSPEQKQALDKLLGND